MGKSKRIGKRLKAFVDGLSPEEAREQLILAYLQMEKCIRVLRGHDAEPVEMLDNGRQTDLELFYRCKKVRAELDMAEKENASHDSSVWPYVKDTIDFYEREYTKHQNRCEDKSVGTMKYKVEVDMSDAEVKLSGIKDALHDIDALCGKISSIFK